MIRIYLAGPIDQLEYEEAAGWRQNLIKDYPMFCFLDPMRREKKNHNLKWDVLVNSDYDDIEISSCVLVNFNPTGPMVGTSMEIKHAYDRSIPVVLVNTQNRYIGPFLQYHVTQVVDTFPEAIDAINKFFRA